MASFVLGGRIVLAAVFATAGFAKLADGPGSRRALSGFGLPEGLVPLVAVVLPLAELATAVALIPTATARWGAVVALTLLLAFIAGIANAMRQGEAPDCHCFGQIHSAPAGRGTLARNAVLAVLAGVVVAEGPGPAIDAWIGDRTAPELAAVGAGVAAVALGALALSLWLERRASARADTPNGLPVGVGAPEFALRGLDGQVHTLAALRARGLPLMLFFVSPDCGPCRRVLQELGRWQRTLGDSLTIVVISQGGPEHNQVLAQEHGIAQVLMQEASEVMSAYRIPATPSAVAVTAQGAIASRPAEGVLPIEPLVRVTLSRSVEAATSVA